MKRNDFIKEYIDGIKEEINELIKENGEAMYSGVFEVINELENDTDHWDELINDLEEDYKEDEADYINMVLGDCIDRELMGRFGKQFGENLTKMGYKYDMDEECWTIKNKYNGQFLTCYGVVWDYWYDLDTDVREWVGETFEREMEE